MYKLLRENRIFMNTQVIITAWTDMDRSEAYDIFNKGFQQFHFVIEKFSRFDRESELSKLNQQAGKKVEVSKELFNLIKYSLNLAKKTNGLFDPTIIDFLEAYGYKAGYDFSKLNAPEKLQKEIEQILKCRASYKDIEFDKSHSTIKLQKNQRIDLGGIGKGYAIDKAFEKLKVLRNVIVSAGGDIRAMGVDKTNDPWLVNLKLPGMPSIKEVQLKDQAVCCSGSSARKVKFFHHLINPRTGKPQNDVKGIFVFAHTAMEADSWATALYASGKKATDIAKEIKLKVLIVYNDKSVEKINLKQMS